MGTSFVQLVIVNLSRRSFYSLSSSTIPFPISRLLHWNLSTDASHLLRRHSVHSLRMPWQRARIGFGLFYSKTGNYGRSFSISISNLYLSYIGTITDSASSTFFPHNASVALTLSTCYHPSPFSTSCTIFPVCW